MVLILSIFKLITSFLESFDKTFVTTKKKLYYDHPLKGCPGGFTKLDLYFDGPSLKNPNIRRGHFQTCFLATVVNSTIFHSHLEPAVYHDGHQSPKNGYEDRSFNAYSLFDQAVLSSLRYGDSWEEGYDFQLDGDNNYDGHNDDESILLKIVDISDDEFYNQRHDEHLSEKISLISAHAEEGSLVNKKRNNLKKYLDLLLSTGGDKEILNTISLSVLMTLRRLAENGQKSRFKLTSYQLNALNDHRLNISAKALQVFENILIEQVNQTDDKSDNGSSRKRKRDDSDDDDNSSNRNNNDPINMSKNYQPVKNPSLSSEESFSFPFPYTTISNSTTSREQGTTSWEDIEGFNILGEQWDQTILE